MSKNKAEACDRFGSKTLFDGQSNQGFSVSDSTTGLEHIAAIIERISLGATPATVIDCYDCNDRAQLDGYRFALVPLCRCCRTERELQITRNRYERRQKR